MCKAVVLSGLSSHLCVRTCILTFKAKAIVEGHAVLLLENIWEKGRADKLKLMHI